jgi:hypothetical protein
LERLGLLWYSNNSDKLIPFDKLDDSGHYNLSYVHQLIRSKPIKKGTSSKLIVALESLAAKFPPDAKAFNEVNYIVFVSQTLDQSIVDAAQPYADSLGNKGRLALIGLGDVVDRDLLNTLSPYSIVWYDPNQDRVLPGWKKFFKHRAYGCGTEPGTLRKQDRISLIMTQFLFITQPLIVTQTNGKFLWSPYDF